MSDKINWGIIGTGAIARTFAAALPKSKTGRLVAVASRSQKEADAFAREFPIQRAHAGYEAILNDKDVHAVYISPPHPFHAEWTIKACRAKKNVLVEKPMAVNHADAMAMVEAAITNDVFLMEAFMYRCHPQTARLVQLIREKAIGDVNVIQATFSFQAGFDAEKRLFKNALAGGGILDVGCYTVSMSRLVAGAAMGKDFADPVEVNGVAHLGKTGIDQWAIGSLRFPGDIVAQVSTGVSVNEENVVRIYGSDGNILLPNPWTPSRGDPENGRIIIQRKGEKSPQEIIVPANVNGFSMEADVVGNAILSGKKQAASPAMTWDDSLGNIRTLDLWRESVGLVYESEKPPEYRRTMVSGEPLTSPSPGTPGEGTGGGSSGNATRVTGVSPVPKAARTGETPVTRQQKGPMQYGRIDGIDKPVSRLVMGVDNQRTFAHSAVMFDDFFERGGNTFDTAWIYAGGLQEKLLGQWMKHRNVRDKVALIAKGAHSPLCTPRDLTRQLHESLERLQTDHADIYIMHRDNPEIPVGEFVEVLNEHVRAGRMKIFGGSNWSLARIDQANAYAKQKSLKPFSVVSNNFSLARMVQPIWKGCIASSDAESRAWFKKTQTPLLAWSSQARGFFVEGLAAPDKKDNDELVKTWYCDDNFQRVERVNELARKKNVRTINIALSYVLSQPFPTYALIGPRLLSETRSSFGALDVSLTQDEVKWLNLEA